MRKVGRCAFWASAFRCSQLSLRWSPGIIVKSPRRQRSCIVRRKQLFISTFRALASSRHGRTSPPGPLQPLLERTRSHRKLFLPMIVYQVNRPPSHLFLRHRLRPLHHLPHLGPGTRSKYRDNRVFPFLQRRRSRFSLDRSCPLENRRELREAVFPTEGVDFVASLCWAGGKRGCGGQALHSFHMAM